jgi:hypothetical protein
LVVEDDVLLYLVPFGEDLEAEPVGFAMLAQFVRMSGAEDDVS